MKTRLLLCITLFAGWCQLDAAAPRPNILFIFSDDHATDAIGAYDGRLKSVNPTPAIDKLAAQGMVMRNSFCTNSICGPSRSVILTGKHSHKNGFMNNGNSFDWDQQTFPKLLQKAGYHAAVVGKWHLGLGSGDVDWNKKIDPSPNQIGFTYSFIMAATLTNGRRAGAWPAEYVATEGFPRG